MRNNVPHLKYYANECQDKLKKLGQCVNQYNLVSAVLLTTLKPQHVKNIFLITIMTNIKYASSANKQYIFGFQGNGMVIVFKRNYFCGI